MRASGAAALLIESQRHYLHELAGVGELTIDARAVKPPHAAVAVAGDAELYIPLEGLVDIAAERERVARELDRTRAEHERLAKRLGNEGFLAKAAPEVIEKDRGRSAELEQQLATLEAQHDDLAD